MRKICKIKFQQLNETKLNRYQLGKLKKKKTEQNKTKQKHNKTNSNRRKKRKLKMYALSEGWQLTNKSKTNPFLSVMFAINLIA